jgi:Mg2+ and Co2+ transporter CorA
MVTALTGLFTMNLYHPEDSFASRASTFVWLAVACLVAYMLFTLLLRHYMRTGVARFTR